MVEFERYVDNYMNTFTSVWSQLDVCGEDILRRTGIEVKKFESVSGFAMRQFDDEELAIIKKIDDLRDAANRAIRTKPMNLRVLEDVTHEVVKMGSPSSVKQWIHSFGPHGMYRDLLGKGELYESILNKIRSLSAYANPRS